MRKIEQEMLHAINNKKSFRKDNTEVVHTSCKDLGDQTHVYLHNNKIATINFNNKTIVLSSCGWHTNTTKSRLNTIIHAFSTGSIYQKNFDWYFSSLILNMNVSFTDGMVIPFHTHWSQR